MATTASSSSSVSSSSASSATTTERKSTGVTAATRITLSSGHTIPALGLGTWGADDGPSEVARAVELAVLAGYRHIDCAEKYGNEAEIGGALSRFWDSKSGASASASASAPPAVAVTATAAPTASAATTTTPAPPTPTPAPHIPRSEFFVTSKVWPTNFHPDHLRASALASIRNLQVGYLDLYLLHWPFALQHTEPPGLPVEAGRVKFAKVPLSETWKAMEKLVDDGLVRSIGISNFPVASIIDLLSYARIPPAVNQVELHPYLAQTGLITFCAENKIHVSAYSPLGRPGQHKVGAPMLEDPVIVALAAKYRATTAQIVLKWAMERGTSVLPKSATESRIKDNFASGDVALSSDDLAALNALNRNLRYVNLRLWGDAPGAFGPAGVSLYE